LVRDKTSPLLPFHKSKNGNRKLIEIPENLATILSPFIKAEGPIMPRKKLQLAKTKATRTSDITWKQNCLRHSFCSYAVAVKGLDWTAYKPITTQKCSRSITWKWSRKKTPQSIGRSGLTTLKNRPARQYYYR
jgi:hypothetical protein